MTPKQFLALIEKRKAQAIDYVKHTAPRLVGDIAINHVRGDFARGGLTHNGFHQWQPTRRQQSGGRNAASQYGPLLSGRDELMHSVTKRTAEGSVTVYTDVPYAAIHNNGGTIRLRVSPRMRKFAWAMYYKETGITRKMKRGGKARRSRQQDESEEAKRWKGLALTRKTLLTVRIPRRQFLPSSAGPELAGKINERLERDLKKIINP